MKRLGVNIDHVATLRNARGEYHPDPYKAAIYVKKKVQIQLQYILEKIGDILGT